MDSSTFKVIVVGGGAAGFFSAINIAINQPKAQITLLEKSNKLLSKVIVSGGGRCNVTNGRQQPGALTPFYPRGQKKLHKIFERFGTTDMIQWLEERGVKTKIEADLRVFPVTDSSKTIADCMFNEAIKHKVVINTNEAVLSITPSASQWQIKTTKSEYLVDQLVWATGSSEASWKILDELGLKRNPGVPSLFTFNIHDDRLRGLMGVTFPNVQIKIAGTRLDEAGPMLITHWGLSGPAVLKLSAWGAREIAEKNYSFSIIINFTATKSQEEMIQWFEDIKAKNPTKKVKNIRLDWVSRSYEEMLYDLSDVNDKNAGELTKKDIQKLSEELTQARFDVKGKSTYKEEFVTCGGIDLSEINLETFECKRFPGLYLAGEAVDIDALTGGFNFQACWSEGWIIGQSFK